LHLDTLKHLRDIGNTLIVVEHDEQTLRNADYIVDLGPGAGVHGGKVTAAGTLEEIIKNPQSLTGKYLAGIKKIQIPEKRRKGNGKEIGKQGVPCRVLPLSEAFDFRGGRCYLLGWVFDFSMLIGNWGRY
jgi:excinuclease UvrABC ATPase subunit